MLHKVLKQLKKEKKASNGGSEQNASAKYPPVKTNLHTGFHAKGNSDLGAKRQRSIGNRNNKPAR